VVKAEIKDKNRYPFIVNATKGATVPVNEPVLMFVKAVDEDGDYLTYEWDFGAFEKYTPQTRMKGLTQLPGQRRSK